MRRILLTAFAIPAILILILAGCGSDDAADTGSDAQETTAGNGGDDTESDAEDTSTSAQGTSGGGVATITFASGEELSTDVLCYLEEQESAGQQILYTATSLSNPYFDLTVFGPQSDFAGTVVTWNETEDFETFTEQWTSESLTGGSEFETTLDGTTITGSGTLTRGEDESGQAGETRDAELLVEC